jgi:hypothetical protein
MRHVGVEGRGHCLWFFATRKVAALATAGAYVSIGFEELPTTGTSQRQALRRYAALRAYSLGAATSQPRGPFFVCRKRSQQSPGEPGPIPSVAATIAATAKIGTAIMSGSYFSCLPAGLRS